MSFLFIARSAKQVHVRLPNNFYLFSACKPLFNTGNTENKSQRNYSLQSSAETALKTQTGIFRTLSESTPVEYLQKFVLSVHDTTGLPWWATIVCTTVVLRSAVTIPLAIYQNFILAKVHNIQLELIELAKELRKETAIAIKLYNWDDKTAKHNFKRSLKKQWNLLVVRENCHPVKASLLLWFQIPMWISFSVALRNLVYTLPNRDASALVTYMELGEGGFGWITNLTHVDPYYILPVTLGLLNLVIIEVQALSRTNAPTKLQRYALNFFRGFSIFMIPVTACVPSCVALYWTTSSLYGLAQNLLLMSPKVKRLCGIPQTSKELEKPYSHIVTGFKQRINSIPGVSKIS